MDSLFAHSSIFLHLITVRPLIQLLLRESAPLSGAACQVKISRTISFIYSEECGIDFENPHSASFRMAHTVLGTPFLLQAV